MKLWILSLASALLVLSNPEARASVLLDFGPTTPQGPIGVYAGPNGTYTTPAINGVDITVQGSGFAPAGLHVPKIESNPYPVSVLSSVANFKPAGSGSPTVTFTIDFFGFKQ